MKRLYLQPYALSTQGTPDVYLATSKLAAARNVELARRLAQLLHGSFEGILQSGDRLGEGDIVLLSSPLAPEDARSYGIESVDQIYGGVLPPVAARKCAYHPPVPNPQYVPAGFPWEFANYVQQSQLSLPGYSAFTKADCRRAYGLLRSAGCVPRLKPAWLSAMIGQRRLDTEADLEGNLTALSSEQLARFGVCIEANLVGEEGPGSPPRAYGGGWTRLGDLLLTSVSIQRVNRLSGGETTYGGGTFYVAEGLPRQLGRVPCAILGDVLEKTKQMVEATTLLQPILCNRYTFNFIRGRLDGPRATEGEILAAVEHSFRLGAATGAHVRAAELLTDGVARDWVCLDISVHIERSQQGSPSPNPNEWILAQSASRTLGSARYSVTDLGLSRL